MQQLLGTHHYGAVSLTMDEFRNLRKLYGIQQEKPVERPPAPEAPKREDFDAKWKYQDALRDHQNALQRHNNWDSPHHLMQAGADINAFRHASADGLRVVAWLARFLETNEDPLKLVVQLASEAGYDVDPEDFAWAFGTENIGETPVDCK
jgi:hypothetical protein